MRVIIEQPVFHHAEQYALELPALFALCSDERHALLTDPKFRPGATAPVNLWLQGLPEAQRQRAEVILDLGPHVAVLRHIEAPKVHIAHGQPSHWHGQPPRLTVGDALRLLRTPLKLLVENRRHDRAFLLWLASPDHRQAVEEAEAKGWIEFEHGGGIEEMLERIRDLSAPGSNETRAWIERLRLWLLFDRDSHPRNRREPSSTSQELFELCAHLEMAAHRLTRRAIENYLPESAMRLWAENADSGRGKKERNARVRAFFHNEVSDEVRHHFNMKKGLHGDLPRKVREEIDKQERDIRDEDLDPLFHGLPADVRRALKKGFNDIGRVFRDLHGAPPEGIPESHTLPQSIFERY